MKSSKQKGFIVGGVLILAFILWTVLIQCVDVQPVGVNGTKVGFASFNTWFHQLTGANMSIYTITDWLGAVPILVCLGFGALGLVQLIKRKSLLKVDRDILLLGGYYILVILAYLVFEKIPINYRPILIEGAQEVSYPSSTTLLVLSVMPTLIFQVNRRAKSEQIKRITGICTVVFTIFMVVGRLISGVHWFSDIVGGVLLSTGLYLLYRTAAQAAIEKEGK